MKDTIFTEPAIPKKRRSLSSISKLNIMDLMEEILLLNQNQKLTPKAIQLSEPFLNTLSNRLEMSKMAALFLSAFIELNSGGAIEMSELSNYFDCSNLRIMKHNEALEELFIKGYIRKRNNEHHNAFYIPRKVIESLKENVKLEVRNIMNLNIEQFFEVLADYFFEADEHDLDYSTLVRDIHELVNNNKQLKIAKELVRKENNIITKNGDQVLILFFCHRLINEKDNSINFYDIESIINSRSDYNRIKGALRMGTHQLLRKGWIESKNTGNFFMSESYNLTDEGCNELLSECHIDLKEQIPNNNLKKYSTLTAKELFYNIEEEKQVSQLRDLLMNDNFKKIQDNLEASGMRKGFNAIFYGEPGTGKTETVYQIARVTERDLFVVDVSLLKSKWVGDSEKNIKELFSNYRAVCEQQEQTPILLFNEADAILGIRQEGAERAVEKMENSIQNIILEEMEKNKGIMIATTNLTSNLDKAFERRFLYKIEFKKPEIAAKVKIWKSMIPALTQEECLLLAEKYGLSGGEIENIGRKVTINGILYSTKPTAKYIDTLCKEESLNKRNKLNPIGF